MGLIVTFDPDASAVCQQHNNDERHADLKKNFDGVHASRRYHTAASLSYLAFGFCSD